MFDLPRIAAGLALSLLVGGLAYWRGSLTAGGWAGAVVTGTATVGFGGWAWGLTLIAFFVSSSLLSRFRQGYKQRVVGEKFEKGGRRDLWQALANGGVGALLALLYALGGEPPLLLGAFAGVMATVNADTWATELGVLNRRPPRLITTLRPVPPGTSGGVSGLGLLATLGGAALVGATLALVLLAERGQWRAGLLPAALLGGLAGSLSDSLLGATLQALYRAPDGQETERAHDAAGRPNQPLRGLRWLNNDLVNLISSLVGGLVAAALLLLIG